MSKMITQQLEEVFQTAALNHVRKRLNSPRDLEEHSDIQRRATEKRDELTARFHDEYDARVDAVRQQLYDETAQVTFQHPAPSGASTTDNDTITLEAHQRVRRAHEADLQGIVDQALRETEDLLERAERRNQIAGVSKEDFANAGERRSGQDRRIRQQSHD